MTLSSAYKSFSSGENVRGEMSG